MPTDSRSRPSVSPAARRADSVHRGMRHRCRMRDQALHAPKRLGQGEVLQPGDEGLDGRNAARQFEGHDGAEAGLLALRQIS